jgi:hypothetical protein
MREHRIYNEIVFDLDYWVYPFIKYLQVRQALTS